MENKTLFDFEPEKIQAKETKKAKDQEVMDLLGRFTAEMLMNELKDSGGHPKPEWGDAETWRFYYLDECNRRGRRLLKQLGWPTYENSEYVNLHTGDIQTLIEICMDSWSDQREENPLDYNVWHAIEHWEPYDQSKPNLHLINYLQDQIKRLREIEFKGKSNLDAYKKREIKKIPEYEKMILQEQQRNCAQ